METEKIQITGKKPKIQETVKIPGTELVVSKELWEDMKHQAEFEEVIARAFMVIKA